MTCCVFLRYFAGISWCNCHSQTVTITVGSVGHPMLEAHYIEWIMLETKEGRQRKSLKPGDKPVATFALTDGDAVVSAYEYCNLHGLWKSN